MGEKILMALMPQPSLVNQANGLPHRPSTQESIYIPIRRMENFSPPPGAPIANPPLV